MMKTGLVALGLLATLGAGRNEGSAGAPTIYFFFGSEDPHAPAMAARIVAFLKTHPQRLNLRPVLLVEDWKGLGRLEKDSPLVRTFEALEVVLGKDLGIPLFDEKGLGLAKAWRITRLPALAVEAGGKAHIAFGNRVNLKELLRCAR